jgi:hypothetical protein
MSRPDSRTVAFLWAPMRSRSRSRWVAFAASILLLLAVSPRGEAQTYPALAEVLGPHGDRSRGCAICHASRSARSGIALENASENTDQFLWGASGSPDYGAAVSLAEGTRFVEMRSTALPNGNREVSGVLVCLSCHDGNLTPENMLQSWSYEHQVGLLALTPFSTQKIPSLLSRDEASVEDHPIGMGAPINPGGGLVFSEGKFSVVPNSPYAQFIANYGFPSLTSGRRSSAYGVSSSGEPYALCTTCHDQHVRNVYVSGGSNPIAGEGNGKFYKTYFFLNGPYDPTEKVAGSATTSSEQFCRQCHFDLSNEGNNNLRARTYF